jgi:hypothetical protein
MECDAVYTFADFSKEDTFSNPDNFGSMSLQNVGKLLLGYTESHARKFKLFP